MVKTGMESYAGMGKVHGREREALNADTFKSLLEYVDVERTNETLIRGAFIINQGPSPSDSGTVTRTPPEVTYTVSIIWQFEDERSDGTNSSEEFSDMMMWFYDFFENNRNHNYDNLLIYAPELLNKHQVIDYFGVECHIVEFSLTCTLYTNRG